MILNGTPEAQEAERKSCNWRPEAGPSILRTAPPSLHQEDTGHSWIFHHQTKDANWIETPSAVCLRFCIITAYVCPHFLAHKKPYTSDGKQGVWCPRASL